MFLVFSLFCLLVSQIACGDCCFGDQGNCCDGNNLWTCYSSFGHYYTDCTSQGKTCSETSYKTASCVTSGGSTSSSCCDSIYSGYCCEDGYAKTCSNYKVFSSDRCSSYETCVKSNGVAYCKSNNLPDPSDPSEVNTWFATNAILMIGSSVGGLLFICCVCITCVVGVIICVVVCGCCAASATSGKNSKTQEMEVNSTEMNSDFNVSNNGMGGMVQPVQQPVQLGQQVVQQPQMVQQPVLEKPVMV